MAFGDFFFLSFELKSVGEGGNLIQSKTLKYLGLKQVKLYGNIIKNFKKLALVETFCH